MGHFLGTVMADIGDGSHAQWRVAFGVLDVYSSPVVEEKLDNRQFPVMYGNV